MYRFRGSSLKSIDLIKNELNPSVFSLSSNYRSSIAVNEFVMKQFNIKINQILSNPGQVVEGETLKIKEGTIEKGAAFVC